jgi:endonuclease/exonuclease/phosphatase family metal-dependent hydrolase
MLRLLTYNIRYGGVGRDDQIASTIRASAPDIVLLQEATRPAVVERVAAAAEMAQWATFRRQSLGFMSRTPVAHYAWHRPRVSRHAFLELAPAGTEMRVFGVHLSAVHAAWTERRRLFEVRALLRSIKEHQGGLHAIAGDFNTLAPGEILDARRLPSRLRPFLWLSGGRIRWRTIQQVLDAGYVDTFRLRHPEEPGFTFPTRDPHLRLDYVFVPRAYADRVETCDVVRSGDAAPASDHFPLMATLKY